jgi:DNA helicase-2/ATP-dependent DNA helicase PcrA
VSESAALAPEPSYLSGLNAPQREAVLTTEGPVLVLAGAGTGKTAALTARLAHLIATRRAWPSEILAVTFTNKAAREMRERVKPDQRRRDRGHALARHLPLDRRQDAPHPCRARRPAEQFHHPRHRRPASPPQAADRRRRAGREALARPPAGRLHRPLEEQGLTPDQVDAGEAEAFANGRGADLYAQYQAALLALNACDFGDLLLHMLVIFRTHAGRAGALSHRFKYLLVDEYQDTNAVQYEWLKLLAEPRRNLCCVGDDDQSIYLARRGGRQHPALRARLSRRGGDPAGAELPLHPAHPRRRLGPHRQQLRAGSARRCGPSATRARRSG